MFKIGDVLVLNNDYSKNEQQIIGIYKDEYWVLQLHSKTKYAILCNYMHNHYKLKPKELEVGKWYTKKDEKGRLGEGAWKVSGKFEIDKKVYYVVQFKNNTFPYNYPEEDTKGWQEISCL